MSQSFEKESFVDIAVCLPDAVVVADTNGLIRWCNPAFTELCGYTQREVIGQRPGAFLQGEETDPNTVRAIHNALDAREQIAAEILNYHKNGHSYWVSMQITPISTEAGELRGYIAVEREISDVKRCLANVESHVVELYGALLCSEACGLEDDPFDTN